MEQTERDALRKLAEAARNETKWQECLKFQRETKPTKVIELLDTMDAQDLRIVESELERDEWQNLHAQLRQERDTIRTELDAQALRIAELVATLNRSDSTAIELTNERNSARAELEALRGQQPVGWFKFDKVSRAWHPQYDEYAERLAKEQGWKQLYFSSAPVAPAQPAHGVIAELINASERVYRKYGHDADGMPSDWTEWKDLTNSLANAKAAQGVNAELVDALREIANAENYGTDGIWNAESYPDEIARTALANAKAQQKGGE